VSFALYYMQRDVNLIPLWNRSNAVVRQTSVLINVSLGRGTSTLPVNEVWTGTETTSDCAMLILQRSVYSMSIMHCPTDY
jgi:hypothetical protein